MSIPAQFQSEVDRFPSELRALLDAELAAGNAIVEIGHSFPAPPVGAFIRLARRVTTRSREAGLGLRFREVNGSLYSGEFGDERRFFFIIEPPGPPPPEPDMDKIREQQNSASSSSAPALATGPGGAGAFMVSAASPAVQPGTPLERFKASLVIDYEKWHDGIGYDLDALRAARSQDRAAIEKLLLARGATDWRDVEALAALGTRRAQAALKEAMTSPDHQVRAAVLRYAPHLVSPGQRLNSLLAALRTAEFYGGLTEALQEAAQLHPPPVMEALFRGALERSGGVAVHFAAMLLFLHGKAREPFDWSQRPFFLRFNTPDRAAREAVFRELCEKVNVDPGRYISAD